MKKSIKSFLAAAIAGATAITSTAGAFAYSYPKYTVGEAKRVVVNWCHGEYDEYDYAGYNFANSGLVADGVGVISAANYVKLSVIEDGEPTNPTLGGKAQAQIAYCLAPNQHITNTSAGGNGYDATVVGSLDEAADSPLEGGNYDKKVLIDLALTYGYDGRVTLNGEKNERHGGNLEYAEYSMPDLIYPSSGNAKKSSTEHRLATQIVIWSIVCGWYEDETTWKTALNTFTSSLPEDYWAGTRSIARLIRNNSLNNYSSYIDLYNYERKMQSDEKTLSLVTTADDYVFTISDIPATVLKYCTGNFGQCMVNSLLDQGLKVGEFEITQLSESSYQIKIKKDAYNPPDGSYKINLEMENVSVHDEFQFVRAMALYSAANQNIVIPTPATFTFDLEAPEGEIETLITKTFNGKPAGMANVEIGNFGFRVMKDRDSIFKSCYLVFESDTPGVYKWNGETVGTEIDSTLLRLSSAGTLEITGLPSDGDFWFYEAAAMEGWNAKLGANYGMPFEIGPSGNFEINFDNHGDGTGILVMDKIFQNVDGTIVNAESEGADKTKYEIALETARFTLLDAEGKKVAVTGGNGVFEYTSGEGTDGTLSLDSNARIVVKKLPAGVYKIVETEKTIKDLEIREQLGDVMNGVTFQVAALEEGATIEDVLNTQAYQKFTNVFDLTKIRVIIEKKSEDNVFDGFQFKITGSNGFEVTGYTEKHETEPYGVLTFEDVPVYDDQGNYVDYVVEELRTMEDGSSALKYKLCAPVKFNTEECAASGSGEYVIELMNYLNTADLAIVKNSDDDNVFGISFTIVGSDGSRYTARTDRSGYAVVEGLPVFNEDGTSYITYTVTENTPVRYEEQLPQTIRLDPEASKTQVTFNNVSKRTNYTLFKWADDFMVEGLKFAMMGSDGTTVYASSDANGLVTFKDLLIYDKNNQKIVYSVYEVNTPKRYYTPKAITNITLEDPNNAGGFLKNSGEMENKEKTGILTINKVDPDKAALSGAVFALYSAKEYDEDPENAMFKAIATTDAKGVAKFKDIGVGREYVVVERFAPYGFAKTVEPYRFTITEDYADNKYNMTYEWVNEKAKTLKVIKKDDVSGAGLLGAIFALYDDTGKLVTKKMTNSEGVAEFNNLDFKTYTLVETSAPFGYAFAEDEADRTYTVEIKSDDPEVVEKEITNTAEIPENAIAVYKVDADTQQALSGAVFSLLSEDGQTTIKTAQSGTNGLALFKDVEEGKYIIKETSAPAGYKIAESEIAVTVDYAQQETYSFIVENEVDETLSMSITKVDGSSGDPLAGAQFVMFNSEGIVVEGPYQSDDNGIVKFKKLRAGETYSIRETKAPEADEGRYTASAEDFTIKITQDTIGYNVSASKENDYVEDFIVEQTAQITKPGSDETTETDKNDLSISLIWSNDKEVEQEYGDLKIVKRAEDDQIEGLSFRVIGNDEEYFGTTDTNGTIVFKHLPVYDDKGNEIEYIVSEVNTPDRYSACPVQKKTLLADSEAGLFFNNHLKKESANILIRKTSDDGKVSGITFVVKDSDNNEYVMTTDDGGEVMLKNLPVYDTNDEPMVYTISENTPKGYKELAPVVIERLYKDATVTFDFHNIAEDKPAVVLIRKTTVDKDASKILGAKFGLYADPACKQNIAIEEVVSRYGDMAESDVSDEYGYVYFNSGISTNTTYYVKEVETKEGFKLSDKVYECKIDENGVTTYREYGSDGTFSAFSPLCINYEENEEAKIAKVIKTDGTSPLEGATFGMYSNASCTNKLAESISKIDNTIDSDTSGKAIVSFSVEPGNTYYIKEISAPQKYQKSSEIYKVEVSADGEVLYGILASNATSANYPVCVNTPDNTSETKPTSSKNDPVYTTTTTGGIDSPPGVVYTTTRKTDVPKYTTRLDGGVTSKITTAPPITWETISWDDDPWDDPWDDDTPVITTPAPVKTTPAPVTTPSHYTPPGGGNTPDTGTALNIGALIALAVASGVICITFVIKGVTARKNKQ